ncbi:hypothetical protein V3C99_008680, partial [Haemonchus contortus]
MSHVIGLIVERCGDVFIVNSNSNDFEISVVECNDDYDVGTWLGLRIGQGVIEDHSVYRKNELPEIRIVQGKAQVLTTGRVTSSTCITEEFGSIPLLCRFPSTVIPSSSVIRVWSRRLTPSERRDYGALWGVTEVVSVVHTSQSPSPSRSTPEADREVTLAQGDRQQSAEKYEHVERRCNEENQRRRGRMQSLVQNTDSRENRQQLHMFTADHGNREEVMYSGNRNQSLRPTQRRDPSPLPTSRSHIELDQSNNRYAEVVLLGIVTSVVANDCEYIGYVWTRESLETGILHLGCDPYERLKFGPGHWIEINMPANIAGALLGSCSRYRPRFEFGPEDCRLTKALFPTFAVGNSMEMDVPVSISLSHVRGEDYVHDDLGVIADPGELLERGNDYIIRITMNEEAYSMKMLIQQGAAKWKILRVKPMHPYDENLAHRREEVTGGRRVLPNHNRPTAFVHRPSAAVSRFMATQYTANESREASIEESRNATSACTQGSLTVAVKPLDATIDGDVRQRVTEVAMVESRQLDNRKQKYHLWLTNFHAEAEFYSNHVFNEGHFFQGRFSIGGKHKNKCHEYLQEVPIPEGVRGYYDKEAGELELHVEAMHKNRKNGACYEVYHEVLGYVRDSHNLLRQVDEPTLVAIAARRLPCAAESGRLVWQIH